MKSYSNITFITLPWLNLFMSSGKHYIKPIRENALRIQNETNSLK